MTTDNPGFWLRLMWAFRYFFLVLTSMEFARQVAVLDQRRQISSTDGRRESQDAPVDAPATAAERTTVSGEVPTAASTTVTAASQHDEHVQEQAEQVDPTQPLLQMLGLMQQEARFIDFLQEDVTHYGDADIGAAARIVHSGCRKVLQQYVSLTPVMAELEQSRVTLAAGFDPTEVRLTGRVSGQGPFTGVLMHKGWKVTRVDLPVLVSGHDARVLAPAEVEV